MKNKSFESLTDEEILKEFVKRFECDGAVLLYFDEKQEYSFGRWRNGNGKKWTNHIFNLLKKDNSFNIQLNEN